MGRAFVYQEGSLREVLNCITGGGKEAMKKIIQHRLEEEEEEEKNAEFAPADFFFSL